MKGTAVVIWIMAAMAAGRAESAVNTLAVCFEEGGRTVGVWQARTITSEMFEGIGLRIDWHDGRSHCPPNSVLVSVTQGAPSGFPVSALGYAQPYEGVHVRLFYDRIVHGHDALIAAHVLAHVLAHEITHILEGIDRHSPSGLMRACWDSRDMHQIAVGMLPFSTTDLDLIQRGLELRAERARMAMSAAPPASSSQ